MAPSRSNIVDRCEEDQMGRKGVWIGWQWAVLHYVINIALAGGFAAMWYLFIKLGWVGDKPDTSRWWTVVLGFLYGIGWLGVSMTLKERWYCKFSEKPSPPEI